ncbi:MAG: FHA domain-containing protein [Nitrosospira sp.]|nr:FHA domain-containing protein [Nitrosospira sp.]
MRRFEPGFLARESSFPQSERRLTRASYPVMLGLVVATAILMTSQICYADKLKLLSVQEKAPGTVTATIAVFAGDTPNAADFRLRFDEKTAIPAKEVKVVAPAELETSVILGVDQSGSMGVDNIKDIRDALTRALSKPAAQLNVALWVFDTEVKKIHGFSPNTAELAKSVGEIGIRSARDGKTKLHDAIALGLSELRNHEAKGPKRLILITDGIDDGSSITEQVVITEANAKGVAISAIGFGKVSAAGSELLVRLAENTGGHFVPAKGSVQLSSELNKLLNLPPPRVFDVLFNYETAGKGELSHSTKLEFTRAGQPPLIQIIEQGISALSMGRPSEPVKPLASDKQGIDYRILLGVVAGLIAILAAYMLSRKKSAEPAPPPPPPEVSRTRAAAEAARPLTGRRAQTMVSARFPPPGGGQPAAYLNCISGNAKGRQFPIEQSFCRIGSSSENELQLSDDYVSQQHASIRYDSGALYLSDNGSRNGTFLNDIRLHETSMTLSPGDEIRTGRTTFKLVATRGSPSPGGDGNWKEQHVP